LVSRSRGDNWRFLFGQRSVTFDDVAQLRALLLYLGRKAITNPSTNPSAVRSQNRIRNPARRYVTVSWGPVRFRRNGAGTRRARIPVDTHGHGSD
jgi:hypothetical protein